MIHHYFNRILRQPKQLFPPHDRIYHNIHSEFDGETTHLTDGLLYELLKNLNFKCKCPKYVIHAQNDLS